MWVGSGYGEFGVCRWKNGTWAGLGGPYLWTLSRGAKRPGSRERHDRWLTVWCVCVRL
jgi:hypothetical protein